MHRSHSTCTFHRTFPLAGHDDPFFLWPLFPGNSRTQSIGADRNQLSVFRVFTRTLATRHSLSQHIDDFFITGGKTVKVMKGHSSVVKKKEKKFFRRRRNSCCWTRKTSKNRARLPRLVKQQLEPRNPFQSAFSESKQLLKPLLPRFTDKSSMTVPRTASVYTYSSNVESVFAHLRLDEGRLTDYKSRE